MGCEKFKTTFKGVQYNYTQLPARKSLRLKFRISKVFSEALPDLMAGVGKSEKIQLNMFSRAITTTLRNSSSEEITNLIFDIVETVQVDDVPIDADVLFSGDLCGMYEMCYWVLKKEYGTFLAVATELLGFNSAKKKKNPGLRKVSQI